MKVAPMRAFLLATLVGTGVAFSPKIVSHGATVAQPARSSVVSRMVRVHLPKHALRIIACRCWRSDCLG
jgi:hypothetical protein